MYLQMYEMLMLEAFILYWMSMFRDQPKPNNQESLAFERAPVLYKENICHPHNIETLKLRFILNLRFYAGRGGCDCSGGQHHHEG